MIGTTLPTPLYPIYQQRFGWSSAMITIIFAAYAFAVIAGLLYFGHQSDRIGRKKVLLLALALSALSAIVFLFANGLSLVIIGRVLSGVSAGIFTGAGTAAIVDYADETHRRGATLFAVVANVSALGAGTLLAGFLAQHFPAPLQLPYAADLALLVPAFAGVLIAPETVPNARGGLRFAFQHLRVPKEIRSVFMSAAIAGVCGFAVAGVFSAVAPEFLARNLAVHSPLVAGALVFLLMEAGTLGQTIVDRLPKRWAFTVGCAVMLLGVAALAGSIALHSLALIFVSAAAGGFGQGVVMGFGLANINERISENRGEVTSAYFVLIYIGLAVPVVCMGFLAQPLGLTFAGLLFCGLTALVLLGLMVQSAA